MSADLQLNFRKIQPTLRLRQFQYLDKGNGQAVDGEESFDDDLSSNDSDSSSSGYSNSSAGDSISCNGFDGLNGSVFEKD